MQLASLPPQPRRQGHGLWFRQGEFWSPTACEAARQEGWPAPILNLKSRGSRALQSVRAGAARWQAWVADVNFGVRLGHARRALELCHQEASAGRPGIYCDMMYWVGQVRIAASFGMAGV